jgi:hypothetical protein
VITIISSVPHLLAHRQLPLVVSVKFTAHCCHGEATYETIRDHFRAGVQD